MFRRGSCIRSYSNCLKYYWWPLTTTNCAAEPGMEGKTTGIRQMTRQGDFPELQLFVACLKNGEYSQEHTLSDYHVIWFMQNHISDQHFSLKISKNCSIHGYAKNMSRSFAEESIFYRKDGKIMLLMTDNYLSNGYFSLCFIINVIKKILSLKLSLLSYTIYIYIDGCKNTLRTISFFKTRMAVCNNSTLVEKIFQTINL